MADLSIASFGWIVRNMAGELDILQAGQRETDSYHNRQVIGGRVKPTRCEQCESRNTVAKPLQGSVRISGLKHHFLQSRMHAQMKSISESVSFAELGK